MHDDAVYVLNALGGGSIQGYANKDGRLIPMKGSNRSLGLDPAATPSSPTPPAKSPSPRRQQLIVTTKAIPIAERTTDWSGLEARSLRS